MNSRNTISAELKALDSQLSPGVNTNPYSVPDGYFEGLADRILARIKSDDVSAEEEINSLSPLLAGLSRKMPFEVPADYFEETGGNLQAFTRRIAGPFIHQQGDALPGTCRIFCKFTGSGT